MIGIYHSLRWVRFQGLQEGQTYRLEVCGTPFHITIAGKMIASDGVKVE